MQNEHGYFVLEAVAGLGKSTFLAHLVKERAWISRISSSWHLVRRASSRHARALPPSSSAPTSSAAKGMSPSCPTRPRPARTFFPSLLRKASAKLVDGEKIVVVIDGLDEAGTRPGENVLQPPRACSWCVLPRLPATRADRAHGGALLVAS